MSGQTTDQKGRPIPKTNRQVAAAPSVPPPNPPGSKAAAASPAQDPPPSPAPEAAAASAPRSRPQRMTSDDEKEGFSEKDVYYMLKDVRQGFEDMQSRLDRIEENQATTGGGNAADMPVIPGGPRFKTLRERAAWETQGAALSRETARSVSASRTRADQQAHTLGLLTEIQYLGNLGYEYFLGFASLIDEKWVLDHTKRGKSTWIPIVEKLALIALAITAIVVIGEGIFQPQNLQYILNGASEPRNLLIIGAIVGVFGSIFLYYWLQQRRRSRIRPGGAQ